MPIYNLSLSFHVRSDRAINGEAGLEIPRFFADLLAAAKFCQITMDHSALPADEQAGARQRTVEAEIVAMIARMPVANRRGFQVEVPAIRSRWDPETKTWDRDLSGFALVFDLIREPVDGVPAEPFWFVVAPPVEGPRGTATFQLAVDMREVG
jgi:hypothetical protein